ncbi:MAG TPA: cytochrome c3 family protein [Stellaceae bacterium]|nr:cytochrome c3 family protein [Stellaceae bacterium]
MQVEATFLTRRGADAVMRKSQTVTAELLRFGRGSDNEVQLPDIRVGLHAATLAEREGGLFIQQAGDQALRVNGESTAGATVSVGDRIHIGPYEVVITAPPAGADTALTVELIQPLGDALERLVGESRIGLAEAGMSRRRWAWVLFLVVAIFGLALPVAVYSVGHVVTTGKPVPPVNAINFISLSWNAGTISNPHRFFAQNCATCHQGAFARVPDKACLGCHAGIGNHIAAGAEIGPLGHDVTALHCTDCHEEHRGLSGMVIRADSLCVDCHATIAETAPKVGVRDVPGFPAGHPQFRATVVADAAKPRFARMLLGGDPKPVDRSNLVFSHAAHLIPTGFLTPAGHKVMTCADCHVPDPGGQGFQPITFEGQCHSCHDLKFDADLPWREVPHGDVARVKTAIEDFYAHLALQGGVLDPDAPAVVRRPVGTPLPAPTADERHEALAWAARRAKDALSIVFDAKRGCAYCHVVDRSGGNFAVAPVFLRTRFLPEAQFDHAKHAALPCEQCHDARHSERSSDVLLPGIATCTACHGSEHAVVKTQSTCTSCHLFHRQELGPMKTASAGQ